jgi:hypothetical protein
VVQRGGRVSSLSHPFRWGRPWWGGARGTHADGAGDSITGAPCANQIHVSRHRQRRGMRWGSRAFSTSTDVLRR